MSSVLVAAQLHRSPCLTSTAAVRATILRVKERDDEARVCSSPPTTRDGNAFLVSRRRAAARSRHPSGANLERVRGHRVLLFLLNKVGNVGFEKCECEVRTRFAPASMWHRLALCLGAENWPACRRITAASHTHKAQNGGDVPPQDSITLMPFDHGLAVAGNFALEGFH